MGMPSNLEEADSVASAALKAYGETGRLEDLDALIAAREALVAVAPQQESYHGMAVMLLADALGARWAVTHDDATWQRGVLLVDTWMNRVPPPDWRAALYLLANGLLRYKRANATGNPGDVADALDALEAARAQVAAGSGVHGTSSAYLADLRLQRFEAEHEPLDLEAAIHDGLAVLGSARARDEERYIAARTLSRGFQVRYEWTRAEHNLDVAIEAARGALQVAPTQSDVALIQGLLGTSLRSRFQASQLPEDLNDAIDAYRLSVQLIGDASQEVTAAGVDNLGNGLAARYELSADPSDLDEAISCSRRALELYPVSASGRPRTYANLGISLTRLAVDRKQPAVLDDAEDAFRSGLTLAATDNEVTARLHAGYAATLLVRDSLTAADLPNARSVVDGAIEHLDQALNESLRGESTFPVVYRLGRLGVTGLISRRLVAALLRRASTAVDPETAAEDYRRALSVAEATKSPLLTEALLRRTLSPPDGLPEGLINEEERLLAQLAALDARELAPADGTTDARRLHRMAQRKGLIDALEDVWDGFKDTGDQGAEYAALRRSPSSALLSLLPHGPRAGLLALVSTDKVNTDGRFQRGLAAMAWPPGAPAPQVVFDLDDDPLDDIMRQFVEQVPADRGAQVQSETWWQLLASRLAGHSDLAGQPTVVSPSEGSSGLPWSLVLERAGWRADGGELPYVVVVPSLAVAVLPEPGRESTWREIADVGRLIGIDETDRDVLDSVRMTIRVPAAPTAPPLVIGDPKGDLAAASDEAAEVARILGVTPLVGADATVQAVVAGLAGSRTIHVAAHADYDAAEPMSSAIHLFDGDLTLGALVGEWSSADIVVLSACEGASGMVVTGGEVLSLSAALLRTGVDTLVASLWSVDDAASSFLMTAFHEALAGGTAAPAALAVAQGRTRAESGWDSPYYWAGFLVSDRGAAL
jgi:tetratricopeptide (TPR) repeat protein